MNVRRKIVQKWKIRLLKLVAAARSECQFICWAGEKYLSCIFAAAEREWSARWLMKYSNTQSKNGWRNDLRASLVCPSFGLLIFRIYICSYSHSTRDTWNPLTVNYRLIKNKRPNNDATTPPSVQTQCTLPFLYVHVSRTPHCYAAQRDSVRVKKNPHTHRALGQWSSIGQSQFPPFTTPPRLPSSAAHTQARAIGFTQPGRVSERIYTRAN